MGEIKIVKKIVLPLVVGQALVFYSKDGAKLQTFPKRIDGIICRDKGIEVTFTTTNSTYRGLIPMSGPLTEYVVGQEIIRGSKVVNTSNEYETIEDITEIRTDGIIARTGTGFFKGLISLT